MLVLVNFSSHGVRTPIRSNFRVNQICIRFRTFSVIKLGVLKVKTISIINHQTDHPINFLRHSKRHPINVPLIAIDPIITSQPRYDQTTARPVYKILQIIYSYQLVFLHPVNTTGAESVNRAAVLV